MTTRLRTIVADDEPQAREKLVRLLAAHGDVEIVALARTGRETVDAVRTHRPDLLLLDIRMPELDGFQTLAALGADAPAHVVFVTAFDKYAIRAFDVRALDYLLKPFDADRLADALSRVRDRISHGGRSDTAAMPAALDRGEADGVTTIEPRDTAFVERLCVRSSGRVQIVRISDVEWIEACGNYVRLHAGKDRPLLREPLRHLLEQLDPDRFVRIHRGAIINVDRLREMRPTVSGDYIVQLESGTRLKLSRSFRAGVQSLLDRR